MKISKFIFWPLVLFLSLYVNYLYQGSRYLLLKGVETCEMDANLYCSNQKNPITNLESCKSFYMEKISYSCRKNVAENNSGIEYSPLTQFIGSPKKLLASFVLTYLVLAAFFKVKENILSRKIYAFRIDFAFGLMNIFLTEIFAFFFIVKILHYLLVIKFHAVLPVGDVVGYVNDMNLGIKIVVFLLLNDFLLYWSHRLRHTRLLWRFHRVHHSTTDLEWQSRFKGHPVSTLFDHVFCGLPLILLGFNYLKFGTAVIGLRVIYDCFTHSSYKGHLGFLKYVLVLPQYHRLHHLKVMGDKSKNFATIFPVWDIVFGTCDMNTNYKEDFGINLKLKDDFKGLLLSPFLTYKKKG